ncbi:hypothetical protein [Okeania sp. SIO1I7]|uniref:hypothetical protein n=1 Tax=Okeania sp. SIO1I7 TaxID=2607772 RepID=UPI0013FC4F2C|nr:hypothetical protein [Okeania sp. SIO1I7]NET26188.1 hypothetical protein [Okeania sp. SIO1I7]
MIISTPVIVNYSDVYFSPTPHAQESIANIYHPWYNSPQLPLLSTIWLGFVDSNSIVEDYSYLLFASSFLTSLLLQYGL